MRVGKLHLSRVDTGFITLRRGPQLLDQCLLLIEGLPRNTVVFGELAVALEVQLRDVELRLALCKLGLGLFERGADRAVIERRQQFSGFDLLPFPDQHAGQHAVHLRANDNALQRQYRTDSGHEPRHIPDADGDHFDRHRRRGMSGVS